MQNFFLLLAGMGLFYTTLTGTLYDMTVADLESQAKSIELLKVAVLEINENLIDIKQRLIQLEIKNQ
jgi:hypothetical protein